MKSTESISSGSSKNKYNDYGGYGSSGSQTMTFTNNEAAYHNRSYMSWTQGSHKQGTITNIVVTGHVESRSSSYNGRDDMGSSSGSKTLYATATVTTYDYGSFGKYAEVRISDNLSTTAPNPNEQWSCRACGQRHPGTASECPNTHIPRSKAERTSSSYDCDSSSYSFSRSGNMYIN